jgi:hypothetical protein
VADGEVRPAHFWEELLQLIDDELEEAHTLVIIGGAAIGLRYDRKHLTTDLDSVTSPGDRKLWAAVGRACKTMQARYRLKEPPKVSTTGVFDPPEDWESRQRSLKHLKLKRLDVKLPERHDLAISKISRGEARDYDAILAMHREKPLLLPTLLRRYEEARLARVGNNRLFKVRFLSLVTALFGEAEADRVAPRVRDD